MTRLMSLLRAICLTLLVLLPLSVLPAGAQTAAGAGGDASAEPKAVSQTAGSDKSAQSGQIESSAPSADQKLTESDQSGQSAQSKGSNQSQSEQSNQSQSNQSNQSDQSSQTGEKKSSHHKHSDSASSSDNGSHTSHADSATVDKKNSSSESAATDKKRSASGSDGKSKAKKVQRGNAPCLRWVEAGVPIKAVVLCVHGLGLHNGTYDAFGKRLSKLGFATYAIDVRGFGSWMEAKGRERVDFEGCLDDLTSTLRVVRRAHKGLPVFVLGESMGGAIALRITAMRPDLVDGLISSVPAGDRFKQGKTALNVAFHFLDGANKQFNVGDKIIEQATQKPELRELWSKDPLARLKLSPNELMQFQHFMDQNHKQARLITDKPVLFVQGVKDKLVRPEGTVELYNQLATKDREIVLIPNAEHLIFEEEQFTDKDIEVVSNWLNAHLQKSGSDVNISKAEK